MRKVEDLHKVGKAIDLLRSHCGHDIRQGSNEPIDGTCGDNYQATESGRLYLETWVLPLLEDVWKDLSR